MTLEELRRAAIAGQPGARDQLARRLRDMFWRSLSKRLPADVADDLTQQVILKIFGKLEDFVPWHDNDAFERWVRVIGSREVRAHSLARDKALVRGLYDDAGALDRVAGFGEGPSTRVRNQDLLRQIASIIERLATPLREAAKAVIAGEPVIQYAARRGLPLGTAYGHRRKARQLIVRALATPTTERTA